MLPAELSTPPPNTTASPYLLCDLKATSEATQKLPGDLSAQYWRFDVQGIQGGKKHGGRSWDGDRNLQHKKGRYSRGNDYLSKSCWFCLSNPNVETHLVVSIGETCYCALAKGPLVDDHILILPIDHCSSTFSVSPEAKKELLRYKIALKMFFKSAEKAIVCYEYLPSTHATLQIVPIPADKAFDVRECFFLALKKLECKFEIFDSGRDYFDRTKVLLVNALEENSSIFYVQLPDDSVISLSIKEKETFPIQFGREVLANLLGVPQKADWKQYKLSKEDETCMAEDFRNRFEQLDPSK